MPSILSHTPLESLLIFQSAATKGATRSVFDSISAILNQNEFIKSQETYDATRLTSTAIENVYKALLEDEARIRKAQKLNGQNGFLETTEPNSRKRKLSPSVSPTPEDVERNVEWMAELAARLYATHREKLIAEIKHEEGQYRAIAEEIRKIEAEAELPVVDGVDSLRQGQNSSQAEITTESSKAGENASADALSTSRPVSPIKPPQTTETPGSNFPSTGSMHEQQNASSEKADTTPSAQAVTTVPSTPASSTPANPPKPPAHPSEPSPGPRNQLSPIPPSGSGSISPVVPPSQLSQPQALQNGIPGQRSSGPPIQGPQQTRFSPIQSQPHSPVILPPPLGMPPPHVSPMRPPSEVSTASRRGSGTPNPPQPPPYMSPQPPYAHHPPYGYNPWPGQPTPQQTYPHLSPYSSPYPHQPAAGGRAYPPNTNHLQNQYPPYGQQSPVQFAPPQTIHRSPSQGAQSPYPVAQQHPQPGWPAITPTTQRRVPDTLQTGFIKSNSPWKSLPSSVTQQMPRPTRERDVSPVEERVEWLQQKGRAAQLKKPIQSEQKASTLGAPAVTGKENMHSASAELTPKAARGGRRGRRGRATSAASSALGDRSRSRSATSHASETRQEPSTVRHATNRSIKPEAPSTPAPIPSDNEQSRSRRRGNTLQSLPDTLSRTIGRSRRAPRDSEDSSVPPPPTPRAIPQSRLPSDPSLVTTTRNFSKTSQTLMNEVLGHKHAGIFTKPITERDAPGYKSLIYRPQDLKSIKAAITAGNKATIANLEEQSASGMTPGAGVASSPTATPTASSMAGKNAVVLLKKTPDLVPPKAIVNSSQLEKELVRMFANAIMFNPLPKEERGFGSIRFGPRGVVEHEDDQEAADSEGAGDGTGLVKRTWQAEEGGIIRDTREMAETVEKAIADWRDVEQATVSFGTAGDARGSSVMRGGSITTSEALGADESAREDEVDDEGSVSGRRKRRKVAN